MRESIDKQLMARIERFVSADKSLAEEAREVREQASAMPLESRSAEEGPGYAPPSPPRYEPDLELPEEMQIETIVLRTGRPVLTIVDGGPQLVFPDAQSKVWGKRLTAAAEPLKRAVRAVGRIELRGHPFFEWVGTGWLIAPDIIVTNRHVAREFGQRAGQDFRFQMGSAGPMESSIDFLEEAGRAASAEFAITDILDIADDADGEPDVAFLRVEQVSGSKRLAQHIELFPGKPEIDQQVAVIGYPASDSRIPDQALMRKLFGDIFDKKRLAPGQLTKVTGGLQHDASTSGGNSGSAVLDLPSGKAVGLHFAGRFLKANFAVDAATLSERLDAVRQGRSSRPRPSPRPSLPDERVGATPPHPVPPASPALPALASPAPAPALKTDASAGQSVTLTLPLTITLSIGAPQPQPLVHTQPSTVTRASANAGDDHAEGGDAADDDGADTEAPLRPEDYADREGYDSEFLGVSVAMPSITRAARDVLKFDDVNANGGNGGHRGNGDGQSSVLRYQHFSVVMSKKRRLCFFSAVNIDGKRSQRMKRPGWRFDPRIPVAQQIKNECYGNEPKFARGHMTRREDPIWGTEAMASLGNADSMHVTNVVPQMQPFNAGIWLGLENYALEHARQDDMKISVFTGPVFRTDDPVRDGVKIPRSFWKVIAFIHDETGELCATGYTMSQDAFLREEEFVFGKHATAQRSLASIEELAGVSFGDLTDLDAFVENEGIEPPPLTSFSQIRFVRGRGRR